MAAAYPDSAHHKLVIYQLFVRLFGNNGRRNRFYGSKAENGCGKFNDISDKALTSLREFGITHIWYTGVLEHATLTDYSMYGIRRDHPAVVKGIAGSPYAVKDYYDVDPDLARNVTQRMQEFEALVARTHSHGMAVFIDFIPNHVSRQYKSDRKPLYVKDFGEDDDTSAHFRPDNNFYYIPGQKFRIPEGISTPGRWETPYEEFPAKATGNDVFHASPSAFDWFETIKLNYGVDYLDHRRTYFDPVPDTWLKMRDVLLFWAGKGVDGFRCDMAEMVPVAFWAWVIPEVRKQYENLIFIAEIYNPGAYRDYLFRGQFDYLYDKVGLYDALRKLTEGHGDASDITRVWQQESGDFAGRMLRFMENHDEQRIASRYFAGDPFKALPAMVVSATLHQGPLMIYAGQELGVAAADSEGYQGDDGRTTIFDYWGIPELQAWTNKGKFDSSRLSDEQIRLRTFYANLNHFATSSKAVCEGAFYDLQYVNNQGQSRGYDASRIFSYLRYTADQQLLIVLNFDHTKQSETCIRIPENVWTENLGLSVTGHYLFTDCLQKDRSAIPYRFADKQEGIPVTLPPLSCLVLEIQPC